MINSMMIISKEKEWLSRETSRTITRIMKSTILRDNLNSILEGVDSFKKIVKNLCRKKKIWMGL